MKWFVYVDAEYYAETHIVEADTPELAAAQALERTQGNTYVRYADDVPGEGYASHTKPAVAVVPFDAVVFLGTESRVARLSQPEEEWEDD